MEKKRHGKVKKVLLIFACVIVVLAVGAFVLLKMTFLKSFPKLKGEPEIGKWYELAVEGIATMIIGTLCSVFLGYQTLISPAVSSAFSRV